MDSGFVESDLKKLTSINLISINLSFCWFFLLVFFAVMLNFGISGPSLFKLFECEARRWASGKCRYQRGILFTDDHCGVAFYVFQSIRVEIHQEPPDASPQR